MSMNYAIKALDSVVGANYERKDLSPVITLDVAPERPLLQSIKVVKAKGKTHYWDEVSLLAAGHGAATYAEGAKPLGDTNPPNQIANVVCRIGKVAQVTDTEAAIWTGAGSYSLQDGEMERLYQEAMDFQTALKTEEVMNEMEWMLFNGDQTNAEEWAGGQCDGIVKVLQTNNIAAGGSTSGAAFSVAKSNAANFETEVQTLAAQIAEQHTPTKPDTIYCTVPQKAGINAFIGGGAGRPLVQVINPDQSYVGGQEIDAYQTGFFRVNVKQAPQLEIAARSGKVNPPQTGNMLMLDSKHFSRADLIPLRREPLARISTTIEAMITTEFTLEYRNQLSSGQLSGLSG
jgi:hypothetical protein